MPEKSLAQKLGLKAGHKLLLKASPAYPNTLGTLPAGVSLATSGSGTFDVVLLFAANRADIAQHGQKAAARITTGGILWLAYLKKSSGVASDLQRESVWEAMTEATGWRPVSQIALDEVWSPLRSPATDVKPRKQS